MKKLLLIKSIVLLLNFNVICQAISSNGWHMPPDVEMKMLVVFAEFTFDVNPGNEPSAEWPKGQVPSNFNNLFDESWPVNNQPIGLVSRFYNDASFGQLRITADYLSQPVELLESELPFFTPANSRNLILSKLSNQSSLSFNNSSNSFSDFDKMAENVSLGNKSSSFNQPNQKWDAVLIVFNNAPFDGGGANWLNGFFLQHNEIDDIFWVNSFDEKIIIHEYSHALFGHNNFHCAGGQHNGGGSNYFGPLQGGWSCLGDANSAFMTCNAWDRDRLNWFPQGRTTTNPENHNIWCHNSANTGDVNANLNAANPNDTGVFWLQDFMTTGDAIRIKLPFIDSTSEYQQWLWLENHQTEPRNGFELDNFIYNDDSCRQDATPGIYAYIQVEKNIKSGNGVFGGEGDYLRFMPANGMWDITYNTLDTLNESCFSGRGFAYEKVKPNPLTGFNQFEDVIGDFNGDFQIPRGEYFKSYIEKIGNSEFGDLRKLGIPGQAFTLTGNNKLGMGTNPSANNMLTEVSFDNASRYDDVNNNRTVYLNGVSVEIIGEQANASNANMMDLQIRVRFDDVAINQNVNYSADNIVLPNIVQNGPDLELAANKCIFIYHGTTPTKVGRNSEDSTTLYKGVHYFSQPTKFFIEPNANAHLNAGATIEVQDDSRLILRPNSSITLDANAKIVLKDKAIMTLHPEAFINFSAGSFIEVTDTATLIIEKGNAVDFTGIPKIIAKQNAKIIIKDDALLQVANGGLIDIQ